MRLPATYDFTFEDTDFLALYDGELATLRGFVDQHTDRGLASWFKPFTATSAEGRYTPSLTIGVALPALSLETPISGPISTMSGRQLDEIRRTEA